MTTPPVTRVAFIGLGHMGGHMCRNVISAGFQVSAYDLDGAALARAAAAGARPAQTPTDCVGDGRDNQAARSRDRSSQIE